MVRRSQNLPFVALAANQELQKDIRAPLALKDWRLLTPCQ
ncbi:unnamed protein product [Acidithrix sp. C25]|nr:unnamed protein product [Acidithrix sp. C25]